MRKVLWVWVSMLLGAAGQAAASLQLNIPPRQQWNNRHGYCGECSIQSIALYFGTYISQARVRDIISPSQEQDVWIPEHAAPIFAALRMRYEVWDQTLPQPQARDFLAWTKGHLQQGHPVIMGLYWRQGTDPAYDHIVPVTGFVSPDATTYHDDDQLIFNDNYWGAPISRYFQSLPDTRAMAGNGLTHSYCLPRDREFACAVTGIQDDSGSARPVRVMLDRWNEPNVTRGYAPVMLNARIKAMGLTPGRFYMLLRFDGLYAPTQRYRSAPSSRKTVFKAVSTKQVFTDQFLSDGIVTYRCVPKGP